jgi:hypothetical protein
VELNFRRSVVETAKVSSEFKRGQTATSGNNKIFLKVKAVSA